MNQIQATKRINDYALETGDLSWHDQYKDSAYVNVGGLPPALTEGDVITIFSQYGEIVDINMPRDSQTGKPRGFAWLMYADQRSTVLAVDNLNGAQVLGRTLRVDHVLNYKQLERDQETGKMKEREERSLAAHPDKFRHPGGSDASDAESDSSHGSIDLDDPMRDYLIEQKRAAKKRRLESGSGGGESKEEKRRRKEERRRKREERERRRGKKAIEGRGAGSAPRDERERSRDDRRERAGSREERDRRDEGARDRDAGRRRDDERESERRREDDRDRRRDDDRGGRRDDYRRRDERDERDDRRGGGERGGSGMSAFADLERLVRGG
ncbi:RNA-binding protein Cwf29 [Rhodotorula kratochvilovae]